MSDPGGLEAACPGCDVVSRLALQDGIANDPCFKDPTLKDWVSHLGGHFIAVDGDHIYTDVQEPGIFELTHILR